MSTSLDKEVPNDPYSMKETVTMPANATMAVDS